MQSAHPYDIRYDEYFEKRTSEKWKNNNYKLYVQRHISSFQEGKCPCCLEALKLGHNWCVTLRKKASKGGEYKSDNIDVIHNKCYDGWKEKRTAFVKPVTSINSNLKRA